MLFTPVCGDLYGWYMFHSFTSFNCDLCGGCSLHPHMYFGCLVLPAVIPSSRLPYFSPGEANKLSSCLKSTCSAVGNVKCRRCVGFSA